MSDSAAKESGATNPRPVVADAASASVAESSTDSSFGEHNLSFTTTDLSLVEMTEIEYTQLQHILYSHMEAQAIDNESENRPHSNGFPTNNSANQTQYLTSCSNSQSGLSANSSGNQSLCPIICQSGLASDSSFMGASNQCLGHIDFQELRMMLLSESSLLPSQAEKTPNSSSVDTSGQSLLKVRHNENIGGINKENTLVENLAPVSEARAKSAVRVRLEDRFNNIQTEMPRCQETQEAGVSINNLVTLIRHSPEVMGVPLHQQQNKCTALVKNKTTAATTTTALQFTCPLFNPNTAPPTNGNANPSQSQNSAPSVLEAAKHQDLALPRAFSICYQQEIEATKQTVGPRNKSVPEHVWIKLGEEHLCKQTINKRSRSRIHPLETNVQRKPLGDIQNMCDNQSAGPAQGTWHAAQPNQNISSGNPGGVSQRRERHNRMERDRRRRIRICCDELNLLVPFCTSDTDKATTLQWTTAFLKYIQERHGDSLKKEFETVFCGKTGRRLKLTRPDSLGTCPPQEMAQSSTSMEIK